MATEFWSINFKKAVGFLGRNGYFSAHGLEVSSFKHPVSENNFISLSPITSKDLVGRAIIEIPFSSVPELIETLQKLTK